MKGGFSNIAIAIARFGQVSILIDPSPLACFTEPCTRFLIRGIIVDRQAITAVTGLIVIGKPVAHDTILRPRVGTALGADEHTPVPAGIVRIAMHWWVDRSRGD